jgi:hypothetical protein
MRWLKGVVIMTAATGFNESVLVELENGRKSWAAPHFKLSLREHVLIAWDYTNDCIGMITTKKRLDQMETERDKAETASMGDVFRNPSDEVLEEDLNDLVDFSSSSFTEESEEDSMVDVFRNPSSEDVDRNSVVELRDDITR